MGSEPSSCAGFSPGTRNIKECSNCMKKREAHSAMAIGYPCSVDECKCSRFQGMTALCGKCRHGLCMHRDPQTQEALIDPELPVGAQASWNLTQMLTSGYSQVNLFGRDLDDPENMAQLAELLSRPSQCVRTLWLNNTNLTTLAKVAKWLPTATSLRELYLLSNREVGSKGTVAFFESLSRCQLTVLEMDYTLSETAAGGKLQPEDIEAIIRTVGRNRKLQQLSLRLPIHLTLEQQLEFSEAFKLNRSLVRLRLFMGPPLDLKVKVPVLEEPYASIVYLRLALNNSRGKHLPLMLAFLMGTSRQLAKEPNESPLAKMALDASLYDRNLIYLIFQFAFG